MMVVTSSDGVEQGLYFESFYYKKDGVFVLPTPPSFFVELSCAEFDRFIASDDR
jgi:hypothetical protein